LNRPDHAPAPEAYSRVTNPERFAGLVAHAARRCDDLRAQFAVVEDSEFPALPWIRTMSFARPPVRLVPADQSAAMLAVAFTSFPGVYVRVGYWYFEAFPACGCDACGGDADAEIAQFDRLIAAVTAGEFGEALHIPWFGDARLSYWAGSEGKSGFRSIDRRHAKAVSGSRPRMRHWMAWPAR
jgi:hypothetical protein